MREIKFRAWDNGTMFYSRREPDPNEHYHNDVSVVVSLTGYCYVIENNGDGNDKVIHALSEDAVPMQFTGLKDKKGNDIYENDLLIDSDGRYWKISFGRNTQDNTIAAWIMIPIIKAKRSFPVDESLLNMEVVGNTFETPDLLKGQ